MDEKQIIRWLYDRGHFWNPDRQNALNVAQSDLDILRLDDVPVVEAAASFQSLDANLTPLSLMVHGRMSSPDGDVGPATKLLMQLPRCAMPDYAPPPEAAFDYGDPELNGAVESYREWKQLQLGSGSWPLPGCDPQRTDVHSTVVDMKTDGASSHQKSVLSEVLKLVERCEAEIGQAVRHVVDAVAEVAQHDVKFQYIVGGTIGFAYFPRPGTCNQKVVARIDNSYNPSAITLANLFDHEYKGHSDGLEHTRGGIMNPSIIVINPLSWIGDPSESIKKRYFGGVPIDPQPVPPPPNPQHPQITGSVFAEPFPGGIAIRGEPVLKLPGNHPAGDYPYTIVPKGDGTYRLIPKPTI